MPTNVTKPKWRCDVCLTDFGERLDLAEWCEAGPVDELLPEGTLLLDYRTYTPEGFHIVGLQLRWDRPHTLTPTSTFSGFVVKYVDEDGTEIVEAAEDVPNGHYWVYDFLEEDRRSRSSERMQIHGHDVHPHLPDKLNVYGAMDRGGRMRDNRYWGGAHEDDEMTWPMKLVGLPVHGGLPVHVSRVEVLRPLTPEIKAALDMLGARPDTWTIKTARHDVSTLTEYAVELLKDTAFAPWWVAATPIGEMVDGINARLDAWWAGGDSRPPSPRISVPTSGRYSASALTPSKLNKEQKAIVAATGVEWQPRTGSRDYARRLIRSLEAPVDDIDNDKDAYPVEHLVLVSGTKGGVGKSTIAAALAVRLAQTLNVVIIDADLTGPSQHLLWRVGAADVDIQERRLVPSATPVERLRVFSPGQVLQTNEAVDWDHKKVEQWLNFVGQSIDLAGVDVVVVDMPPGQGPVQEWFDDYRVGVTHEVMVTTGHELSIADTARGLSVRRVHHDQRGRSLIENLSTATGVTGSGEEVTIRLAGRDGAALELAREFDVQYVGSLPYAADTAVLAESREIEALAAFALQGREKNTWESDDEDEDEVEEVEG